MSEGLAALGRVESRKVGGDLAEPQMPGGGACPSLPPPPTPTLGAGELREGFQQVSGQVWCDECAGGAGQRFYLPGWLRFLRLPAADADALCPAR